MNALQAYLDVLCPLVLDFGHNSNLVDEFTKSFTKTKVKDVILQFLTDSTCASIFIEYQDVTTSEEAPPSSSFSFLLEPTPAADRRVVSLSLVKCNALPIDTAASVASQLRVIKLHNNLAKTTKTTDTSDTSEAADTATTTTNSNGLHALYDFVHHTFAPLIRSEAGGKVDTDNNSGSSGSSSNNSGSTMPAVAKSLKEFEYALKNCMQHTEIPEVTFQLEPEISVAVDTCSSAASSSGSSSAPRPSLEDLGFTSLDESSDILQRLTNSVKRWTLDIQKVTSLDRDIQAGAAVQEINFWRNMETALESVETSVGSLGVELTIEILNREKQFYVTIPFRQDTGLKKAKKKVDGYMQLLRDFPINAILTSPNITTMTDAVLNIFNHLRRMKSAQYPVERGFRLLEAISKDLSRQIIEILASLRLMKLSYTTFVELTDGCDQLFRTWDEQSSHFRELARDIAKKRGESRGALPTRLSLDHRSLQTRIEDVCEFRKNHEKLRDVISRVLPSSRQSNRLENNSSTETETKDGSAAVSNAAKDAGSAGSGTAIDDVRAAYQHVIGIDVLDVGKDGTLLWESAKRNYEIRIDHVESQITEKLTDLLATAKTGDEKFRVFSKFNALFFRHRIRGAIQQHQAELIATVKEDIQQLQNMFKRSYTRSEAERMSTVRDLPPMSGKIIWAKQIERQLTMYINRIEAVLGKDWERHTEGRSLKTICDSFRRKLDTQPIFDEWMARINIARTNNPNFEVNGNIFSVVTREKDQMNNQNNEGKGMEKRQQQQQQELMLKVSFDPDIIMLFKEVRNLHWLNQSNHDRNHFRVPYTLKIISDEAKEKYPYAMALNETLRTYQNTLLKVNESLKPLVAGLHRSVQSKIHGAFKNRIRWDSEGLEMYVKELSEQIYSLQERVEDLLDKYSLLKTYIQELSTCSYMKNSFNDILCNIQKVVDELNLAEYTNLDSFTKILDNDITKMLSKRLNQAILAWTNAVEQRWKETDKNFKGMPIDTTTTTTSTTSTTTTEEADENSNNSDKDYLDKDHQTLALLLKDPMVHEHTTTLLQDLPETVHEIGLRNQVLMLRPPIESARVTWHQLLNHLISIVTKLSRIQSSRYDDAFSSSLSPSKRVMLGGSGNSQQQQRGGSNSNDEETDIMVASTTYSSIIHKVNSVILRRAYTLIELNVKEVSIYIQSWFQYQALWDMSQEIVFETLGNSVEKWQQLLRDIKRARSTFDNHEQAKEFGFIVVDYGAVQQKVSDKYDVWHREMLSKFGTMLSDNMRTFHTEIQQARTDLEVRTLDADVVELIEYVTSVQNDRRKYDVWSSSLETYKTSQRLLQSQRYQFPSDWMWLANIEGEWDAFSQILDRKWKEMESKIPSLQKRILKEDRLLETTIRETENEWKIERNTKLMKSTNPQEALQILSVFEQRLSKLQVDHTRIVKALDALDLNVPSENKIDSIVSEVTGFHDVFKAIGNIWKSMVEVRDRPWRSIVPRKVQRSFDAVLKAMDGLSPKIQQYEAFQNMKDLCRQYKSSMLLLSELRSDALKDRHWRKVHKILELNKKTTSLLLSDLLDAPLKRNEKDLKDIIIQAQGEMALEQFMSDIRDNWNHRNLDLVDYQNKTSLIRGWDDLFDQLDDHLSSLNSMKQSPYFKVFEDDSLAWEDKLTRLRVIFDIWIDVQRRWIYLEGIFYGSADIKQQLPNEFTRFKSINSEFVGLMRNVRYKPAVLNVLSMSNCQRTLERLSELLDKIQRALGKYLERQRSSFPRFYFVGDEDLLEIIGNSKDPIQVQRHVGKMFAAIATLECVCSSPAQGGEVAGQEQHPDQVVGMSSREGEIVQYDTLIDVKKTPKINDWLSLVESQMQVSLATLLAKAVVTIPTVKTTNQPASMTSKTSQEALLFLQWVHEYPAQIVLLASSVNWSKMIEDELSAKTPSSTLETNALMSIASVLTLLADQVLDSKLLPSRRKKYEQLITEYVHQRDSTRRLINEGCDSKVDFEWLYQLRYYWHHDDSKMSIEVANASFYYGFEYLGVAERLVQTPLTDRCYLTLTQALNMRMGGNPFGPAGTGKTESVKMLGAMLGRFVLVFNCDESFDFNAMGRIFVGLCQVGAWGCFDEFNRLEERILSAVSQQILSIQIGLQQQSEHIQLLGNNVLLNSSVGIFVTMNPGYAGRSNLPDNLKQLFRGVAMMKPDYALIAQVAMLSQGFRTAEMLSGKVVLLFNLCMNQLSLQPHYDFGLRALKSVLASAGNLKRESMKKSEASDNNDDNQDKNSKNGKNDDLATQNMNIELDVLMQSVCETILPKLVAEDISLFHNLLQSVFPTATVQSLYNTQLKQHITNVCQHQHYQQVDLWIEKIFQLYQVQHLRHGVMMVGPSGAGKTSAWRTLLQAMELNDGIKSDSYVIDAKAMSKEDLYGTMDSTTLEWTDGIFTSILRNIINNVRGESNRRHWIIFDCDVDPEWAENLNSVLDDNKLLTLPSGERLSIPPNVRIMFETETLKYATLATVSRCGMIWFSQNILSTHDVLQKHLKDMKNMTKGGGVGGSGGGPTGSEENSDSGSSKNNNFGSGGQSLEEQKRIEIQVVAVESIEKYFVKGGMVEELLHWCLNEQSSTTSNNNNGSDDVAAVKHVMSVTPCSLMMSTMSLVARGITNIHEYNENHYDFPMQHEQIKKYMQKWLIFSMLWGLGGSMNYGDRLKLCTKITRISEIALPNTESNVMADTEQSTSSTISTSSTTTSLIDYEVNVDSGDWRLWLRSVPSTEIETHQVLSTDVVIPTVDTVRHVQVLHAWLAEHRPLILCGPPGSGKTMTLTSVLTTLPNMELASLNFSSSTTPELILKTFEQYCEYRSTRNGPVLSPTQPDKWLVVFCDEINLPENDAYGTQSVIMLLRQLTEHGGFWRKKDNTWVTVERIQFVGACNPPTDPGRVVMSPRFLRHAPLLFVDYPAQESLRQIYGTFSRGLLKLQPALRAYSGNLTEAMVSFYTMNQAHFTPELQPHYVYSPRELSRWIRAIYEAIHDQAEMTLEQLVRVWLHEGLRLFHDRLVLPEERAWCESEIDKVAVTHFPAANPTCLSRPVLYSNWLSNSYVPVEQEKLRQHVEARLKTFHEEELNVELVVFDEVLDHVLRIDRVLRQPLGHLLLVGESGSGKTVLSRYVFSGYWCDLLLLCLLLLLLLLCSMFYVPVVF